MPWTEITDIKPVKQKTAEIALGIPLQNQRSIPCGGHHQPRPATQEITHGA
jgi:hypothetical protein